MNINHNKTIIIGFYFDKRVFNLTFIVLKSVLYYRFEQLDYSFRCNRFIYRSLNGTDLLHYGMFDILEKSTVAEKFGKMEKVTSVKASFAHPLAR